jgi:hypothetical protein
MPTFVTVLILSPLIKLVNHETDNISSRLLFPCGSHTVLQWHFMSMFNCFVFHPANSCNPLFTWMFLYIYEVFRSNQNRGLQIAAVCMVNTVHCAPVLACSRKDFDQPRNMGTIQHDSFYTTHICVSVSTRNALSNKERVDSLLYLCLPHCNRE